MKDFIYLLLLLLLLSGCFLSKKDIKYGWPTYQITEIKKDTSGVELKILFYEYHRQTTKEEFIVFAKENFKTLSSQYYVKLKKGEKAKPLKLKKIDFYFQNKYPYKSTKGNAAIVFNDKDVKKEEWQTYLGTSTEQEFIENKNWWDIALIKRVPKKDKK